MTAYAILVTFVLGSLSTLVILYSYVAWKDGKALKILETQEKERHAARLLDKAYREDDEMQEAVDLVADKLGGTILSYEK